jgi:hypothetical protein
MTLLCLYLINSYVRFILRLFLDTEPEVRVRFPALPDFLRSSVGQERGPLSLVSTTEELLGRKSSGFGLENREYGRRDPSR